MIDYWDYDYWDFARFNRRPYQVMKLVYICGPYTAETEERVKQNILQAETFAIELANRGIGFICPHLNSAMFDYKGVRQGPEFWYAMTMALLRKSDAVLVMPGYQGSAGSMREIVEASRLQLPVFYASIYTDVKPLHQWYFDSPERSDRARPTIGRKTATVSAFERYLSRALAVLGHLVNSQAPTRDPNDWVRLGIVGNLQHADNHADLYSQGDTTEDHLLNRACRTVMALELREREKEVVK